MNCPKCGFVQEERADCKKCGVVFAKFFAFHAPESGPALMVQEPLSAVSTSPVEQSLSDASQLHEVTHGLRNLEQRFHELEFERAERRRLHGEMRAIDIRLQEGLARVTACQEEVELHAGKLSELPPVPSLQDFSALQIEVRALDILSLHKRIERMEDRIQSFPHEQSRGADALPLETVTRLDERLEELENRLDKLAEPKGAVIGDDTLTQLGSSLQAFEELKASLQNVTLRYTEIGELKKNHLVLHNMIESLQHAMDSLKKDPSNGTAAKMAEIEKEVSALKAEVRKNYERIELLETHPPQAAAPVEVVALEEFVSLREDFAAAGRIHEEEKSQMQSRLEILEARVGESLAALAELPGHMEAFTSQIRLMDQQYQSLAGTLAQLSKETHGIPQKTAELHRDVEQLGEEYLQTRMQIRAMEEKINSLLKPPTNGNNAPALGDMQAIRENLDEIRRFMATLSRKL